MDNRLVFYEILKHLELEDMFRIRRVCSTFKNYVENYFENVESLTIFFKYPNGAFADLFNLLKLNYGFCKGLRYEIREEKSDNENILLNLFPNIKELCWFPGFYMKDNFLDMKLFLQKWPYLKKLMIPFYASVNSFGDFFKLFNFFQSLETFVVCEIFSYFQASDTSFRFEEEPFLTRIKHLFIPYSDWLNNIADTLNLETLGVQVISEEFSNVLHKKIQNFIFLDFFYSGSQGRFKNFLTQLSDVNKDNLRSLKIFQESWVSYLF